MRYRVTLVLLTVAFMAACQQQVTDQSTMEAPAVDAVAEEALLDDMNASYVEAANSHDATLAASFWTEDAIWMPAEGPHFQGRAGLEQAFSELFAQIPDVVFSVDREGFTVSQSGDIASAYGTYGTSGTAADGTPVDATLQYVASYQKVDGEWKLHHAMGNRGGAPAEAENPCAGS